MGVTTDRTKQRIVSQSQVQINISIQTETEEKEREKNNNNNRTDLWENIKWSNINVIGVPEAEEKVKQKKYLKIHWPRTSQN